MQAIGKQSKDKINVWNLFYGQIKHMNWTSFFFQFKIILVTAYIIIIQKKSMNSYLPTNSDIANVVLSNVKDPSPSETDQQYERRIDQFVNQHPNLRNSDIDYFIQNRDGILAQIKIYAGNSTKWVRTMYMAIKAAGKSIGQSGIKSGWGQLVNITSQIGIRELSEKTFIRAISSNATWIIAGLVFVVETGIEFMRWHQGEITGEQFFINVGKKLFIGVASVGGGAGGAALGALVGGMFGGVGAIVGIGIGGVIGGVLSSFAASKLVQIANKYDNPKKLYLEALKFLQLPLNPTKKQIEMTRKAKYTMYHPDIWKDAGQSIKRQKSQKLIQMLQYLEIVQIYHEVL